MRKLLLLLTLMLLPVSGWGATWYISPTGNDVTGDGSTGNPWLTPAKAISSMSGGDTLLFKDGTYTGSSFIITTPPVGTAEAYTVIKAENDFQAIIDDNWEGDTVISLSTSTYTRFEGLIIKNSTRAINIECSSYVKFLRMGIKNGTEYTQRYGNVLCVGDDYSNAASQYILFEDVFIAGCARYSLILAKCNNVLLRRCVIRWDGSTTVEPTACLSFYGDTGSYGGSHDNIAENCIFIDSTSGIQDGVNCSNGGYNITIQDCIFLNTREILLSETKGDGNKVLNTVFWDIFGGASYGHGIAGSDSDSNPALELNQLTIGLCDAYAVNFWNSDPSSLKNSYILNNTSGTNGLTTQTYNTYIPAEQSPGGEGNSTTDPGLLYIVRTDDAGTGESGAIRGASIIYKRGTDGTYSGDSGYNTLTANTLWPFPYESTIKALFSEADSASNTNPTNNVDRGFCAAGTTLTTYIWEYLGNTIPSDIYGNSTSHYSGGTFYGGTLR